MAAIVIGDVGDVARFATRDSFAAYNGTAPIEVSSGPRKIHRLSRRGNRRINHAIHMAAVTQIRHRHSTGRGYYDPKVAEGTPSPSRAAEKSCGPFKILFPSAATTRPLIGIRH